MGAFSSFSFFFAWGPLSTTFKSLNATFRLQINIWLSAEDDLRGVPSSFFLIVAANLVGVPACFVRPLMMSASVLRPRLFGTGSDACSVPRFFRRGFRAKDTQSQPRSSGMDPKWSEHTIQLADGVVQRSLMNEQP